jgi:hypothetical protein
MLAVETESPTAPAAQLPTRMLTDRDVALLFGVCGLTVARWARKGLLPPALVLNGRRYWSPGVIARMVEPDAPQNAGGGR